MVLASCAPVTHTEFGLNSIGPNKLVVLDMRACTPMAVCWPWTPVHRETVQTNSFGAAEISPEEATGKGLGELADPIAKAASSFSWGLTF
jgi:hypothetical protein